MAEGVCSVTSARSVDEVVARLQASLQTKGIKLFCTVNHADEAAAAGFSMPATKLLIFGNPKAGTPVMLAAPSAALDLPLKILVAETTSGTLLSWSDPVWLGHRHGIPDSLLPNLKAVETLAREAAAGPHS